MTVIETADRSSAPWTNRLVAGATPLAVVGLAYALATISDWLLYVGPLDRATFGWSVVVPIWALAPLAAGFAWRRLAARARKLAAIGCGLVVGGVAAALVWQDVVSADCQAGPTRTSIEWLAPAATLGLVIGGALAIGCLAASSEVRAGRPWRALIVGAVAQVATIPAAGILAVTMFYGTCQRP